MTARREFVNGLLSLCCQRKSAAKSACAPNSGNTGNHGNFPISVHLRKSAANEAAGGDGRQAEALAIRGEDRVSFDL
jgi:hypothetical protein